MKSETILAAVASHAVSAVKAYQINVKAAGRKTANVLSKNAVYQTISTVAGIAAPFLVKKECLVIHVCGHL